MRFMFFQQPCSLASVCGKLNFALVGFACVNIRLTKYKTKRDNVAFCGPQVCAKVSKRQRTFPQPSDTD